MRHRTRLRDVRRSQNQSVGALAKRAKCSPTHVHNLEAGRIFPGLALARRLADALGVDVDALWPRRRRPAPVPVAVEEHVS